MYKSNEVSAVDVDINELIASLNAPDEDIATPADVAIPELQSQPVSLLESRSSDLHTVEDGNGRDTVETGIAVQVAEPEDVVEDLRPIVRVKPGSLQEAVRMAESVLAATGRFFQRAGTIVHVQVDGATGDASIHELAPLTLVHVLDGLSVWLKYDGRSGDWKHKDPDEKVCKILLKAPKFDQLKPLVGVARQPFLRPDGSVCFTAGYDDATGLYGAFGGGWVAAPAAPTRDEAMDALAVLQGLVSEFPFARSCDNAAALSAMLTAVLRPSLTAAPMFHVRAHQIASGKTYLCALITAMATPRRATPVGFPSSEDECGKLLLAQLLRSPAVIEFDNLTCDLRALRALCTALTSDGMEGRVLGGSKVQKVGTRALFLSSGNNVGPVADMTRRCLTVNLDPRCDTPASRTFSRPYLVEDVHRDRQRYVSAALTVVLGWIAAGRPDMECKAVASFGEWSGFCRQSLMWLGMPDPATAIFESMAEDPERQLLGQLLCGWRDMFGTAAMMTGDVVARAKIAGHGNEDFAETLIDISGDRDHVNHRKLGRWIARHVGVVVNGLRFARAPRTRNAESWRIESVESVMPTASKEP